MLASKKQSYIVDLDWDVADMSSSDCWDALHWSWEEWKRIRGDYVAHRRRRSSREPTSFIPLLNWILNTTVYKSLWLTRSDWEGHTHTHTRVSPGTFDPCRMRVRDLHTPVTCLHARWLTHTWTTHEQINVFFF